MMKDEIENKPGRKRRFRFPLFIPPFWLFSSLSDIENDPRMPQPVLLPDSKIVIRHAFDLGTKTVTRKVEFLSTNPPIDSIGRDLVNGAAPTDEAADIELSK
jgi:hypothetical protein